jgi:hypothetical protein
MLAAEVAQDMEMEVARRMLVDLAGLVAVEAAMTTLYKADPMELQTQEEEAERQAAAATMVTVMEVILVGLELLSSVTQ